MVTCGQTLILLASYTFSGIALVHPRLITDYPNKRKIFPLREVFSYFIEQEKLSATVYSGQWCDVGTPDRLYGLETLCASLR